MFNRGDIVTLKSGGPLMTVSGIPNQHSSACHCQWFDQSDELQNAQFRPEALVLAKEHSEE